MVFVDPARAAADTVATHDAEWLAVYRSELDRLTNTATLPRAMTTLDLSLAELGRLFGVSRQAATKWVEAGPPPDRAAAIADLGAICDLLSHHVKPERIAGVVRRPADAFDGQSILEMFATGNTGTAADRTREMFMFVDAHA